MFQSHTQMFSSYMEASHRKYSTADAKPASLVSSHTYTSFRIRPSIFFMFFFEMLLHENVFLFFLFLKLFSIRNYKRNTNGHQNHTENLSRCMYLYTYIQLRISLNAWYLDKKLMDSLQSPALSTCEIRNAFKNI